MVFYSSSSSTHRPYKASYPFLMGHFPVNHEVHWMTLCHSGSEDDVTVAVVCTKCFFLGEVRHIH